MGVYVCMSMRMCAMLFVCAHRACVLGAMLCGDTGPAAAAAVFTLGRTLLSMLNFRPRFLRPSMAPCRHRQARGGGGEGE